MALAAATNTHQRAALAAPAAVGLAAGASALLHLAMAWQHRGDPLEGALMLAMALACLHCAVGLARGGCRRTLVAVAAMALAMAALHLGLLAGFGLQGFGGAGFGGHHHAGPDAAVAGLAGSATAGGGALAMVGVAVCEIGLAWAAARAAGRAAGRA
ncbi:hypothetical protein JT358_15375 [Micrococcales bacterium 31B]|nr:hypothetical protein [Micrococcales bacterium 31B]